MHQTLNVILKYLKDSGKILDGRKGRLWGHNSSSKLDKVIKEGVNCSFKWKPTKVIITKEELDELNKIVE